MGANMSELFDPTARKVYDAILAAKLSEIEATTFQAESLKRAARFKAEHEHRKAVRQIREHFAKL